MKLHAVTYVTHLFRLTFVYGLLYEHSQLNPQTHDTLHEFSGYVTAKVLGHLSESMRHKVAVSSAGKDIYLPDAYSEEPLSSSCYREHIKQLDLPITFIVGACYVLISLPVGSVRRI